MDFNRRKTRQRDMVFKAVYALEHPTAQDAYNYITKASGDTGCVSLGTVYRNLQILEDEGKIASIGADPTHYDRKIEPHYHLHCKKCGSVSDMPIVYKKGFDCEAETASGFYIESHTITFEGLCNSCSKLERNMALA
jgi:Fur family peroxide stress response transcriptional regulator